MQCVTKYYEIFVYEYLHIRLTRHMQTCVKITQVLTINKIMYYEI